MYASLAAIPLPSDVRNSVADLWAASPASMQNLEAAYLRAQRVLPPDERGYTAALTMSALAAAAHMPNAGSEVNSREGSSAAAEVLRLRAAAVVDYVGKREAVIARHLYARGLAFGVGLSLLLLVGVGFTAYFVIGGYRGLAGAGPGSGLGGAEYWSLRDVLVCVGGGAAGAAVSVLLRLHNVADLDVETVTCGTARYRIMLGWFFAAAVLFLIKGGVLTFMDDPTKALIEAGPARIDDAALAASWFYWGGIGFLAGFNERWAMNLLTRDSESTKGTTNDGAPNQPQDRERPLSPGR